MLYEVITHLMDQKYGTSKSIPQLIMAGGSVDDVFVIVMFTAFTGLALGGNISAVSFLQIPVSILSGLVLGVLLGCRITSYNVCYTKLLRFSPATAFGLIVLIFMLLVLIVVFFSERHSLSFFLSL